MSKLGDEIKARGLKFADVVDGKYEMLCGDEIEMICDALEMRCDFLAARENIEPPPPGMKIDRRPSKWWKNWVKPHAQTPARIEHAWRLRQEGMGYREIGDRLGVVNERARTMVKQFKATLK